MKKFFYISAAAMLCAAAVSCQKVENAPAAEQNEIQFDFTIGSPSAGTKAAKTGWASGDKLNVWFGTNSQQTPDLVLTYDGTQFVAGSLRAGVQEGLAENGDIWMVYEGYNDLSKYSFKSGSFCPSYAMSNLAADPGNADVAKYVAACPLIVFSDSEKYDFDGSTISANIDTWYFFSKFKVLVKNYGASLDPDNHTYYLQVKNGADAYAGALGGFYIGSESNAMSNYTGFAKGVKEADGLAFYYKSLTATSQDITFNLYADGDAATKKTCKVTNKTVSFNDNTKCQGVAIDFSKFTEE